MAAELRNAAQVALQVKPLPGLKYMAPATRMSYMTKTLTAKQQGLLDFVAEHGRVESVYTLSKLLSRPYRRVFDHVKVLQKAGLLKLSPSHNEGRRHSTIEVVKVPPEPPAQPQLSYSRSWSSPVTGVGDRTLIASVLAEPTFGDVLKCARHYGLDRVRDVYGRMLEQGDLKPWAAIESGRILSNIEIGFARAAQ